jgi:hypothetical protein
MDRGGESAGYMKQGWTMYKVYSKDNNRPITIALFEELSEAKLWRDMRVSDLASIEALDQQWTVAHEYQASGQEARDRDSFYQKLLDDGVYDNYDAEQLAMFWNNRRDAIVQGLEDDVADTVERDIAAAIIVEEVATCTI